MTEKRCFHCGKEVKEFMAGINYPDYTLGFCSVSHMLIYDEIAKKKKKLAK